MISEYWIMSVEIVNPRHTQGLCYWCVCVCPEDKRAGDVMLYIPTCVTGRPSVARRQTSAGQRGERHSHEERGSRRQTPFP